MCQGIFNGALRVFQACFKGVSMNFNTVLGKFQGYLKKGSRKFQGRMKSVSREGFDGI